LTKHFRRSKEWELAHGQSAFGLPQKSNNGGKILFMIKYPAASTLILGPLFASSTASYAKETGLFRLTDRGSPVGINAREPSLAPLSDGRVLLSWTEESGTEAEVRMAILNGSEWSDVRTINVSSKTYINWADFPSVVALAGGGLAAQWLGSGCIDFSCAA
jgi:hypothetical protein